MTLGHMTIKALDHAGVYCQTDGCEVPAFYLISNAKAAELRLAYCELHARQFAQQVGLRVPATKATAPLAKSAAASR